MRPPPTVFGGRWALPLVAAFFATGAAQAASSLSFCIDGAPEGFDPAQYETVATEEAAGLPLYDKLLQMKPGGTELVPGLAQSWELSADGRSLTLHLRHGVKFHTTPWFTPTREMNADDVLWSIQRIDDPKHPDHAAAHNGFPYWAGMGMHALLKSVEKVDAHTVRITLTRPEAPFLANLTISAIGAVYSAEYAEQLRRAGKPEQMNTLPVGTGPYAFKSYQKDAVIRYAANTAYWGGAPKIDNLIFAITPDPAVAVQRLKAGECQVAVLPANQARGVEGDTRLALVRSQPLMTSYIAANTRHRFLSDRRFRLALSLAVDRGSFLRTVYSGLAEAAGSFLPPGIWSHDAALLQPQDVERAGRLVRESGYDGSPLSLFAIARDGNVQRGVELLQADWARIGVKVQVRLMELGELYKRTGQGEHDLALLSWFSDNGDPDNFFTPNLSCAAVAGGGNKAQWCNPDFDALLAAARATADTAERTALYRRAQRLLHDEAAVLPLAYKTTTLALDRRYTGVLVTPFGAVDLRAAAPVAASR